MYAAPVAVTFAQASEKSSQLVMSDGSTPAFSRTVALYVMPVTAICMGSA